MIEMINRWEICGIECENPMRWIVIRCNDAQLIVYKWAQEAASAPHARHYGGEAHADLN